MVAVATLMAVRSKPSFLARSADYVTQEEMWSGALRARDRYGSRRVTWSARRGVRARHELTTRAHIHTQEERSGGRRATSGGGWWVGRVGRGRTAQRHGQDGEWHLSLERGELEDEVHRVAAWIFADDARGRPAMQHGGCHMAIHPFPFRRGGGGWWTAGGRVGGWGHGRAGGRRARGRWAAVARRASLGTGGQAAPQDNPSQTSGLAHAERHKDAALRAARCGARPGHHTGCAEKERHPQRRDSSSGHTCARPQGRAQVPPFQDTISRRKRDCRAIAGPSAARRDKCLRTRPILTGPGHPLRLIEEAQTPWQH